MTTSLHSLLSRLSFVECTYIELCRKKAGDRYVTSAVAPSSGKIIAWSTVWLALNEQIWVTVNFSLEAATAWRCGRSWIWNNETVNGLNHRYWFFYAAAYVLYPWSSTCFVASRTYGELHLKTQWMSQEQNGKHLDDLFFPRWTLQAHISYRGLTDLIKLCSFYMYPCLYGSSGLQSPYGSTVITFKRRGKK